MKIKITIFQFRYYAALMIHLKYHLRNDTILFIFQIEKQIRSNSYNVIDRFCIDLTDTGNSRSN